MPGIRHIAEKAGVSKTVVSVYMNNPTTSRASSATKARIDAAVRELKFRPNAIARSLSARKSHVVGVLVPLNTPLSRSLFMSEMLSGLESLFFQGGYSMLFPPTEGRNSSSMVRNQLDRASGYDGLVLFGTRFCTIDDMEANISELSAAGIPFVVLNMPTLKFSVNQVSFHTPPSAGAARFLLEMGHRRILFMAGAPRAADSQAEVRMYRAALKSFGLDWDAELVVYGNYEHQEARAAMGEALRRGVEFSAVYCLTDAMALGVYEALAEAGLHIPADVSVVGKNDSFFARFMNPPLTTVRVPIFEAGVRAAEILVNAMEKDEAPRKVILNNELINRLSVRVKK
jgi:DNA-binding LacI/PurR family transcriptional regulator